MWEEALTTSPGLYHSYGRQEAAERFYKRAVRGRPCRGRARRPTASSIARLCAPPSRARLLDQLELQLAELEEQVAQNAAADEIAALPAASTLNKPPRCRPARRPLPAHLPRERIMQADAYSGFNSLYVQNRQPEPITQAACWAHFRRKLFELARLQCAALPSEGGTGRSAAAIPAGSAPPCFIRSSRRVG